MRRFVVPGDSPVLGDGVEYDAYWMAAGNRIIIARRFVRDGLIVRHEILHALLGRGDHPPEYFRRRCAGIVDRNAECRAEAAGRG